MKIIFLSKKKEMELEKYFNYQRELSIETRYLKYGVYNLLEMVEKKVKETLGIEKRRLNK